MKRLLFIMIAAATIAFAGCSKDDDNELSSETQGNITLKVVAPSNDIMHLDKVVYYDVNAQFLIVDWGDGSAPETYSSSESSWVNEIRHTYANSSTTYTVQIKENGLTSFEVGNFYRYTTLSLDFNGCPTLEDLSCSDPLLSLNVSECTALKKVLCRTRDTPSRLTSVNVRGCSALELFDISCYRGIPTPASFVMNVSGCPALKELDCFNTGLTSLNISGCPGIKMLMCGTCQLKTLDVRSCSALEELLCYQNQLTSLDVSGLNALRVLNCHDNKLTTLNISGFPVLEDVDCKYNDLTVSSANAVLYALPNRVGIAPGSIFIQMDNLTNFCDWAIARNKNWVVN
jgi:Leucine-rich repeat (LRR) protein